MNEQIREFAKQAITNVPLLLGRLWNAEKESYEVDHDELVKIAQLIWEEAYQAGFDQGREEGFDDGYDQAQASAEYNTRVDD
jgi:flagellar biosynthesis/type III secretory pathway protein FliH